MARAGARTLFPIVLFILPVLFVITQAPGLLIVLGICSRSAGAREAPPGPGGGWFG